MVFKIRGANQKLRDRATGQIIVGSMDMEALYPSVDKEEGARIVAEEELRSKIEFKGADVRKAVTYLAVTLDKARQRKEGIGHLMASRM